MPRQDYLGSPATGPSAGPDVAGHQEPRRPSRRAVLRGAAGAGAASVTATALSGLAGSAHAAQVRSGSAAGHETDSGAAGTESADQFVLHVRDARAGHIDVFRGTSLTRLHDPELAARLVLAIRR